MKNLIIALFGLGLIVTSNTVASTTVYLKDNVGNSRPVMANTSAPVYLDSSEIDTSEIQFDMTDRPTSNYADTVGIAFMRCKDSSGTDTTAGLLKWQMNPCQRNGTCDATWDNIDSVAILVAGGVLTQTSKPVINTKSYMRLRFILRNQSAPDVAKKSKCDNILLNSRKRIGIISP